MNRIVVPDRLLPRALARALWCAALLTFGAIEGAVAGPGASLDMVPGKKSDTADLARAAAKAAERQQRLAQLDREAKPGDAQSTEAKGVDAKDGRGHTTDAKSAADVKSAGSKPNAVESMSDGTMRIRPSADPRKAIDAIRERLANRGVQPRVDAEGNALLRVGTADAKAANGNRLVMTSATMKIGSARSPVAGAALLEHGKAMTDNARRAGARAGTASPGSAPHAAAHWSYDGESAPEQWARLSPEWATCAKGTRQSPIDIHEGIKVELEAIRFEYRPSAFTVVDNGHTIQVNLPPGNAITVAGKRYELLQFHFHKPAEERVDGKPFDMVVHLVHKDAAGKLAVIAVLLEKGSAQNVVQNVWNHLPLEKGDEVEAGVPLDPGALLPAEHGYYTYMGSLTTPPCSEGVLWMVMKQPVGVSPDQLAIFARLYPMNARPLQADSSRLIKESN